MHHTCRTHDIDIAEAILDRPFVFNEKLSWRVTPMSETAGRYRDICRGRLQRHEAFCARLDRCPEGLTIELRRGDPRDDNLLCRRLHPHVAVAFVRDGRPLLDAAAGIMWIAGFRRHVALGRTFEGSAMANGARAVLVPPRSARQIYVGKLLGFSHCSL